MNGSTSTNFDFEEPNDWRIDLLRYQGLSDECLTAILSRLNPQVTEWSVRVLEPGLSGFQVLVVTQQQPAPPPQAAPGVLLKTRRVSNADLTGLRRADEEEDQERIAAQAIQDHQLQKTFVRCEDRMRVEYEGDTWICLRFPFVSGSTTFKDYFSRQILDPGFVLAQAASTIGALLKSYAGAGWKPGSKIRPWAGSRTGGTQSLDQREYAVEYLQNVHRVLAGGARLARAVEIKPQGVRFLLEFVQSGRYQTLFPDPNKESFLVGSHGDLNGGNVLLPQDGTSASIIDLGRMSLAPNRPALYDVAKLSIELERFILPSAFFDRSRQWALQAWVQVHRLWLHEQPLEDFDRSRYRPLYRLYSLLSVFREWARDWCKMTADAAGIVGTDGGRMFLFARLHHLLRMVNHPNLEDVRKLFAIRAALDVLDLLLASLPEQEPSPVPAPPPGPPPSFDCTTEEFVSHLAAYEDVTIIGVTNQWLKDYLDAAWSRRCSGGKGPWKRLRVVFLSRSLVEQISGTQEAGMTATVVDRTAAWDQGVRQVRDFFTDLAEGRRRAECQDIRRWDRWLPFVGQLYDERHVRVAYILPDKDIRNRCYMNLWVDNPPCKSDPPLIPLSNLPSPGPLCREPGVGECRCERCRWGSSPRRDPHSPCGAILQTFGEIVAQSTPLFVANVCGYVDSLLRFRFVRLVPQTRWRSFSFEPGFRPSDSYRGTVRPAHLMSFILFHTDDYLLLQWRTSENASGELERYGIIPGKVNDEDFFVGDPPPAHRQSVFDMQSAVDGHNPDGLAGLSGNLAASFASLSGTSVCAPFDEGRLNSACEKAAYRTLREKLGAQVEWHGLPLKRRDQRYLVEDQHYLLFITLFVLKAPKGIGQDSGLSIPTGLRMLSGADFESMREAGKLTRFLVQNFDDIRAFVK